MAADSAAASPEPEPFAFQTTSSPDASAGGPSAAFSPDAAQLDVGDFSVGSSSFRELACVRSRANPDCCSAWRVAPRL